MLGIGGCVTQRGRAGGHQHFDFLRRHRPAVITAMRAGAFTADIERVAYRPDRSWIEREQPRRHRFGFATT